MITRDSESLDHNRSRLDNIRGHKVAMSKEKPCTTAGALGTQTATFLFPGSPRLHAPRGSFLPQSPSLAAHCSLPSYGEAPDRSQLSHAFHSLPSKTPHEDPLDTVMSSPSSCSIGRLRFRIDGDNEDESEGPHEAKFACADLLVSKKLILRDLIRLPSILLATLVHKYLCRLFYRLDGLNGVRPAERAETPPPLAGRASHHPELCSEESVQPVTPGPAPIPAQTHPFPPATPRAHLLVRKTPLHYLKGIRTGVCLTFSKSSDEAFLRIVGSVIQETCCKITRANRPAGACIDNVSQPA